MDKQTKKRAVVVCPGRGTYNKPELGYLGRHHHEKTQLLNTIDANRLVNQQTTIAELDGMKAYSMAKHTAGENASSLIYACAAGDFLDIDQERFDIVAVTGNSMGWYISLAVSGALNAENGIELINTMGSMMTGGLIGGQMIYPVMDENWHICGNKIDSLMTTLYAVNNMAGAEAYLSIKLGGYYVLAGNDIGLKALEQKLERIDDTYPMRLFNHAAFHTPMLSGIATRAQQQLGLSMFGAPTLPLIDGEGRIWQPYATNPSELRDYTLGTQVEDTYDFSRAMEVAIKEFAPDNIIVLGPGATLGGAIGQCMIKQNYLGMTSKQDFVERQKHDPVLHSMGMEEQRNLVVS